MHNLVILGHSDISTGCYILFYTANEKSQAEHTVIFRQSWELIDVFHCVLAVRHYEAELKVKALKETVAEVMLLDHAELIHRLLTNSKLHTAQATDQQIQLAHDAIDIS